MAALPVTGRDITRIERRDAVSSGPKFRNGDTLLARITPCLENGKGAKVSGIPGNGIAQGSTEFIVMRAKDARDENFVYYLSRHPDFRRFAIQQMSGTSGRQRVAWQSLATYEIAALDIIARERIGAVLAALDDKIELNRRMNETLEASARALFRDWFVDFGPTRAKAEGRSAYLAANVWSLFPDRSDEDGVPNGWIVYSVGDLAEHHTAGISPGATEGEIFEHYSLPAFDAGGLPALDRGGSIKSNKTLVPPGTVLLSKLNPETSRVWIPNNPNKFRQVASTEFLAFTPKTPASRSLLFALFRDDGFRQIMGGMVTGTSKSHQRISPPALRGVKALRGSPATFAAFDRVVAPLLERILSNKSESRTLAATRDALLPKLMSGELRVADVEALAA